MRENCLQEFDAHWQCLEKNNQVGLSAWGKGLTDLSVLSSLPEARDDTQQVCL